MLRDLQGKAERETGRGERRWIFEHLGKRRERQRPGLRERQRGREPDPVPRAMWGKGRRKCPLGARLRGEEPGPPAQTSSLPRQGTHL